MEKLTYNQIISNDEFLDGDTFLSNSDGLQFSKYFLKYQATNPDYKKMTFTRILKEFKCCWSFNGEQDENHTTIYSSKGDLNEAFIDAAIQASKFLECRNAHIVEITYIK